MTTIDDCVLSNVTGGASRPLSPDMQRRVDRWLDSIKNEPNLRPKAPGSADPQK